MKYVLSGRVFDGIELYENKSVRIDDSTGRIDSVSSPTKSSNKRDYDSQRTLEIKDGTILPGLIDTHVHFFGAKGSGINEWATTPDSLAVLRSVSALRALLEAGFTTVRELGTKSATMLAKAADEGHFPSPRIISCSRALAQTGGDDDPPTFEIEIGQALASYTYFCDGPWECRRAVRKIVRDGGKCVKLYASGGFAQGGKVRLQFTSEEIRSIVDEAHRAGLKVAAHAYGEEALLNAIEGGVDTIEHGLGLTEKTARLINDRGIFYIPTLVTYQKIKSSPSNPAREKMVARHFKEDMELVKKYSLKITMGSDIVGDETRPHGRNYEEIVQEASFVGNNEALIASTSRAAECLDLPDVGKIMEGYVADIVIVRGNPVKDIEALAPENILYVFKSGRLVYRAGK